MDTLYVFLLKLAVPWAVCSAPLHRVVYIAILTVSEIIGQVVILETLTKEQIHSVVVMGAGNHYKTMIMFCSHYNYYMIP